ncbi:MAG: membrane protease subunit HflK [Roseibaca calidilacus]|uniref:Protein HflK n=1 Tax=Roseibaca calidilacus TaxID=1666912 RepID=A0A0P7WL63_9RHOB|nr:FtsH protease activity modulator HflK [Roseibaca calidilacus]KPP91552.1 MAG: membrane protease subunit HflK [Roseibaca calidilacus]CUX82931.1 protease FtsH subunit HflK [Roseibaca calidilacus]
MSGNNGGPWGGGNRGGGNRGGDGGNNGPRGNSGQQVPEIEEIVKKGQEQLRVLMGGRGGGNGGNGGGMGGGFSKRGVLLGLVALVVAWAFASFYTVRPEERSVELLFGQYYRTGNPGLNFAPWPVVSAEVVQVTTEQVTEVGTGSSVLDSGLMLTRDEAVVDIEFQVVWNIADPARFLFNLADPRETVRASAESAMRDIIARSELAPILNRDRGAIAADLQANVQEVLDSYDAGINVIRVNFDKADPPDGVISAFRDVQTARQERDRLEREADAYANRVLAEARGQAAQIREEAEGYRAQVVNTAQGEASRFVSVYTEYVNAPEVTRKRMYLETMEQVLGDMNLTILDNVTGGESGSGVLPYLPLNELGRQRSAN